MFKNRSAYGSCSSSFKVRSLPVPYDFMKSSGVSKESSYKSGLRSKCPFCSFSVPIQVGVDAPQLLKKHLQKSQKCRDKQLKQICQEQMNRYADVVAFGGGNVYGIANVKEVAHEYNLDYNAEMEMPIDGDHDIPSDDDAEMDMNQRGLLISDNIESLQSAAHDMLEKDQWSKNKAALDDRFDFAQEEPSCSYIELQYVTMLRANHGNAGPLNLGWIRDKENHAIKSDWRAILDIYNYVKEQGLSNRSGDRLLALFSNICRHHGAFIPIPKSFYSISEAVNKSFKQNYDVIEFTMPVLELFLGTDLEDDLSDFSLPVHVIGSYIDPMRIIAEEMVMLDETDFVWNPVLYFDEDGPIVHDFIGSKVFSDLVSAVKTTFKNDARVISISMSCDDTVADKVGKKKLCPVYIKIMNRSPSSLEGAVNSNMYLVGFAPILTVSDRFHIVRHYTK